MDPKEHQQHENNEVDETTLAGCLKVLQKICVRKHQERELKEQKEKQQKKEQKTSSDIPSTSGDHRQDKEMITGVGVDDSTIATPSIPDNEKNPSMIFNTINEKMQKLMKKQRRILELTDAMNAKLLMNKKCDSVYIDDLDDDEELVDNVNDEIEEDDDDDDDDDLLSLGGAGDKLLSEVIQETQQHQTQPEE